MVFSTYLLGSWHFLPGLAVLGPRLLLSHSLLPMFAVGCGDSFAAAVVLGFTREHSIPAVMALANAVGAATAMGQGAGRNVASAERVSALLCC